MRLFTGIDLPDPVKERLDALISRLRAHAHVKWSPAYNLHVTTKFIGDWPPQRLAELDAASKAVPVAPIEIDVRGLGWFPNAKSPRGKQIHVGRVTLYECQTCGHLMPTPAGQAKVDRNVEMGIRLFLGRLH